MKIDMLSIPDKFSINKDDKKSVDSDEFLKVFTNGLLEESNKEEDSLSFKAEEEMESELISEILAIMNKLFLNQVNEGTNDTGNSDELLEKFNKLVGSEEFNIEGLKELNGGNQVEELLKALNLDGVKFSEELGSEKNLLNLLYKLIGKEEVKEELFIQNEKEVYIENGLNNQEVKINSLANYENYIDGLEVEKEYGLLDTGNFKHRNIIIEEKSTDIQGEFNLLNRIAYSVDNFNAEAKVEIPVLRSEFLETDIVNLVKYINNSSTQELNVKITPRELGEVNIKLLKSEESSELIITLTNKEAFKLIKENISDIEKQLSNLSLKIKDITVQVKNEVFSDLSGSFNEQFNKDSSKEDKRKNFNRNTFEEEEKQNIKEEANLNLLI